MLLSTRSVPLAGALATSVFAPGCAGSPISSSTAPASGAPPGPGGTGVPGVCIEERSKPDVPNGSPQYTTKTWDPDSRILVSGSLKWRFAAEGRIIAYIGVEQQPFQHDYSYDA